MGVNNTEIKIGKYIIKGDGMCLWIDEEYVGQRKDGKAGKPTTKRVAGYVSNYEELFKDFIDVKARSAEAREVKDVLKQFNDIEADLKKLIQKSDKVRK